MARRKSEKEQKLATDAYLLRDWRPWHRDQLDEALAGPHGNMLQSLMALLEKLNMQSGKELIGFIRAQNWHIVDAQTKLVILHEINTAITKLRTSNGKPPIDDGLWGEPVTVFQAVRLIVVPIEAKPAESFFGQIVQER
jgi:hypothetical protein